ncbi:MAG: ABC transporter permease [Anaerolineaceae bacterium]
MNKFLLIAWKDLKLIFRDRSALILMLLAPFLITLGMGFITGRFSGSSSSGIADIPVAIVNQDEGQLGQTLIDVFESPDLDDLVNVTLLSSPAEARRLIDEDRFSAAILIPEGFTASTTPEQDSQNPSEVIRIEFISNPNSPTYSGILRSILDSFLNQVEVGRIGAQITVTQLIQDGLITPDQAAEVGQAFSEKQAQNAAADSTISLNNVTASGTAVQYDTMAYLAPGMALMFLMYTVTYGGHSFLWENRQGTLPRMLQTPTTSVQILGGKAFGIFLTSVVQLLILIGGSSLLFNLKWGNSLGVLVLVLAAAFGATGWGMILAAFFNTPGQVSSVGSALMLIFGIVGGSFFDISQLPGWVAAIGKISPNSWGIRGFTTLAGGGTLKNIRTPVFALLTMGVVLFSIASVRMRQRGLARK